MNTPSILRAVADWLESRPSVPRVEIQTFTDDAAVEFRLWGKAWAPNRFLVSPAKVRETLDELAEDADHWSVP